MNVEPSRPPISSEGVETAGQRLMEFRLNLTHLGQMMPMFLWVDQGDKIRSFGPTLQKVLGEGRILGTRFSRHFRIGRVQDRAGLSSPAQTAELPAAGSVPSRRLGDDGAALACLVQDRVVHLTPLAQPRIGLRGRAFALGDGGQGGILMNLSFASDLGVAVRELGLTDRDFSPADLAMEMLYLQEANALVMGELRALTARLDEARVQAEQQALSDPLTGLANRRAMQAEVERAVQLALHGGEPFALIQIDLDHFKAVNDRLGHAAGDHVLQQAARNLCGQIGPRDLAARMGGDEFLLLLRGDAGRAALADLGARLIAALEEPKWFGGRECRISGSLGIVRSRDYDPPEVEAMLSDADAASYRSKAEGRGRSSFHTN